jgi:molybdopterin molybdotransferase
MISVAEARARILDGVPVLGAEVLAVTEAHGRVLAVPVVARLNQPPADVSAMDGYALRAADAAAGARLRLIGEAPAGQPFAGRINPGETVRLFTGSVVPEGADAILIQENAEAAGGEVAVREACSPGRHIRRAGQDFAVGDELLTAGRRLTARDIGLAAAANHPFVTVVRRPRVAILATGDEISLPGEPLGAGGIVSSNSHILAALVAAQGCVPLVLPIARDDARAIAEAADAARGADILVTTGGASIGAHDLVQAGLQSRGFALEFWKIAMRPGKPLIFGRIGGMPVLGLPGNPVSAYVCAVLFLGPLLARMAGAAAEVHEETARLGASLPANDQREDYVRATLTWGGDGWVAVPFARQDSAMLTVLARAQALVVRAPFAPAAEAGEIVRVVPLNAL